MPETELIGQQFNSWIVNSFSHRDRHSQTFWNCTCTLCGREYAVSATSLKNGTSKRCRSCSAKMRPWNREKATAASMKSGLSQTKLYQMLANMHRRCEDETNNRYNSYGARGIKVCEEWSMEHVKDFYDWAMEHGYQEGLEIDRIDVDGDYCPDNCRFVTRKENMRNTRRSKFVIVYGERMTLAEAVERFSPHPYMLVLQRIRYGMGVEEALTRPKKPINQHS